MGRPRKITKHEATGEQKPVVSLYQLMGMATHPYKTLDAKEYEGSLDEMNLADLQEHAIEMNIVPVDDRERLTDRLVREFLTTVGNLRAAEDKQSEPAKGPKATLDILSRGR